MEVNINNINTVSEVDMVCFTSESNQITSSLLIIEPLLFSSLYHLAFQMLR